MENLIETSASGDTDTARGVGGRAVLNTLMLCSFGNALTGTLPELEGVCQGPGVARGFR